MASRTAGLQTVLVFLVVLTSGLQYLVQKVNYRRDLEKVRQTMRDARLAAWGPKMVPLGERRKVCRFQDRVVLVGTPLQVKVNLGGGPRIDEGGNIVPGRMVDMVVDGNGVYLVSRPMPTMGQLTEHTLSV